MIRLRVGYLGIGILTGLFLMLSFCLSIPDGKLHITVCDVGQGDGVYIRFPDGRDLVIDGGPGNGMIRCLSEHMPFWDRAIDLVVLTHPQADHFNGLLQIIKRYDVGEFLHSGIISDDDGYRQLRDLLRERGVRERILAAGDSILVGGVSLSVVWPSRELAAAYSGSSQDAASVTGPVVLGSSVSRDVNDGSVVLLLTYGGFDALFMGDADGHIQPSLLARYPGDLLSRFGSPDGRLEMVKVAHHGNASALTPPLLSRLSCITGGWCASGEAGQAPLAVVSVGKNTYGHPDRGMLSRLEEAGFRVLRTDRDGDIRVVGDGFEWHIQAP